MRKNEIIGLTRKNVDLVDRIIHLTPEDTKEGDWQRVPIHKDLVPVFRDAMKVASLDSDRIFLIRDKHGVRPPSEHSTKNPWRRASKKLGLVDPRPRFHDLRHTWRANARRSKVDWVIAERIMGHSVKKLSGNETYGEISDEELRQAADSMTFDNGATRVLGRRFDADDGEELRNNAENMCLFCDHFQPEREDQDSRSQANILISTEVRGRDDWI